MKAPASVLVIVTRRIGDVLLATPLIRSLRRAWPGARIDALVFAGTEQVLEANADLDRVITIRERPGLFEHLALLRRLWRRYDLAIATIPGDRPTLYAFAAGRYRVGMLIATPKHRWKQTLLHRWAPFDDLDTHTVLMALRLADLLGIPRQYEVVVAWSGADEERVAAMMPFPPERGRFALLHVFPKFAYKTWHMEGWRALVNWLDANGLRVVLVGSGAPEELAYIEELAQGLGHIPVVNLAGRLSLPQVGCLASRAAVYVGTDTAVTHLAAAAGAPTIALFGPSNPVKWGPWPRGYSQDVSPYSLRGSRVVENVTLIQGVADCVPCMNEGCDRHVASLSECLQTLPAARVINAVAQALEQRAAQPRNQ